LNLHVNRLGKSRSSTDYRKSTGSRLASLSSRHPCVDRPRIHPDTNIGTLIYDLIIHVEQLMLTRAVFPFAIHPPHEQDLARPPSCSVDGGLLATPPLARLLRSASSECLLVRNLCEPRSVRRVLWGGPFTHSSLPDIHPCTQLSQLALARLNTAVVSQLHPHVRCLSSPSRVRCGRRRRDEEGGGRRA